MTVCRLEQGCMGVMVFGYMTVVGVVGIAICECSGYSRKWVVG